MTKKNIITKTYDWATGEIKETVTGVKRLVRESKKAIKNAPKDKEKFMKGY